MLEYENRARKEGYRLIAGIDEAGRGPLAGPVVACSVILPIGYLDERINDSKKLSESLRNTLYTTIKTDALSIGTGIINCKEIDKINILEATKKAMVLAVSDMTLTANLLLIDGRDKISDTTEQWTIKKGDSLSQSIAAASIIAKVTRDQIMYDYHKKYPQYNFSSNKGYGTKFHREALQNLGSCNIHRRSFIRRII